MKVWKIGSNWGCGGKSVLPFFLDYGVAFFGGANDGHKKGDHRRVAAGDYLLICEGIRLSAIGRALTPFMSWSELSTGFRKTDRDALSDDDVVGCRASIELLHGEHPNWSIDPRKRFCAASMPAQEVADRYSALKDTRAFDIASRTVGLHGNDGKDALFSPSVRYLVPIYQRPYSWGEAEVSRLIQEIVRGIQNKEPIFLGTMQVAEPVSLDTKGTMQRYDIIDGQQRISSLYILTQVLSLMGHAQPPTCPDGSVLRTLVDRGSAQRNWEEFLAADLETIRVAGAHRNPYLRNAAFIHDKIVELLAPPNGEDHNEAVTGKGFTSFLSDNIRIVVIETRAGLSKTIQIFNTINTTGLDLSGADVFKVRLFEFLKDRRGHQDSVFEDISALYGRIQEESRKRARSSVSMPQLLSILQALVVAYYDLPVGLFDYANDRFFDHLFDSLLGVNQWPHFATEKLKLISEDTSPLAPLTVHGIERLITARYCFEDLFDTAEANPAASIMLNKLIWHSRYGWRYWHLPVIHLYLHEKDEVGVRAFFTELVRLTLSYSLIHKRTVYAAHTCLRKALRMLVTSSAEATQYMASVRAGLVDDVKNILLKAEIAWNPTWKSIACRLSELLASEDELGHPNKALLDRVFDERVDIEHIQAYNDKDGKRREDVWRDWGTLLNGVGNLAMLETSINRSISNGTFAEKKAGYARSQFTTIRNLTHLDQWDFDACKLRCEEETRKLMAWLSPG